MELNRRAAAQLEGLELNGGWVVGSRIDQSESTGGNFSFGYHVNHPTNGKAFLKALDYSSAMEAPDVAAALKAMTEAYLYERTLLEKCNDARMTKVVLPIAHGQISLPGYEMVVNYLIFEQADGDVRKHLAATSSFDYAWAMRVLHNVAVGIQQLHRERIVHQDVKPSNVLTFGEDGGAKLGDLGRGEYQGTSGPHVDHTIPGDRTYAPPEQLYGHLPADWGSRRRACDLYHLGSMILFLFAGTATTPAIVSRLAEVQHPDTWSDTYAAVMPYVRNAFDDVATDLEQSLPAFCRTRLAVAFRELCDPAPEHRGHPKAHSALHADSYSVERYVSLFNFLALQAEVQMQRLSG